MCSHPAQCAGQLMGPYSRLQTSTLGAIDALLGNLSGIVRALGMTFPLLLLPATAADN